MPQLILEFSPNILEKHNLSKLFAECHSILVHTLPTELASCKSRSIEADTYYVGNGDPSNAFVHVTLKVLAGRTVEVRNEVGKSLMAALKAHFAGSLQTLNLQITTEIMELEDTYFKL